MAFRFIYREEKHLLLKETRGVGFNEVIAAVEKGDILDDLQHHNQRRYPNQHILVVKIHHYVYAVPYVIDRKNETISMQTVYPSRSLNKKYLGR